jgi:protein O-GlcNAc transferase
MSPEQLFEEAARLETAGEEAAALQVWKRLVEIHPDAVSLCRLARLAERLGEPDEAEQAFRCAIVSDPNFGPPYIGLGSLLIDRGEYRDAADFLGRALQLKPSEDAYCLRGIALKCLGKIEEARQSYLSALKVNSSFEEAYYNLGVLTRNSDPAEAETLYSKALECSPDYAEAHRELGWQLTKRQAVMEAESHIRRAIELQPADAWAHIYLANLLWSRGDIEAATAEYEWARESAPEQAFPLWSLANLYEDQEDWAKAQPLYERAIALEPDDVVANMNFGRMLKKKGDLPAAKEYLERALLLDPDYTKAKDLLVELQGLQNT